MFFAGPAGKIHLGTRGRFGLRPVTEPGTIGRGPVPTRFFRVHPKYFNQVLLTMILAPPLTETPAWNCCSC